MPSKNFNKGDEKIYETIKHDFEKTIISNGYNENDFEVKEKKYKSGNSSESSK